MNKQDYIPLMLFREASLASHTAQQEIAELLVMSVIYPESFCELSENSRRDLSLQKTCAEYCPAKTENSLEDSYRSWWKSGIALDGFAHPLLGLEPYLRETGFSSWLSAPTASMTVPSKRLRQSNRKPTPAEATGQFYERNGRLLPVPGAKETYPQTGSSSAVNPEWIEQLMGFPIGWTELDA